MISTENRAKLDAIAEGLTPELYRDTIWLRRDLAHGPVNRSSRQWPFKRPEGWAEKEAEKKAKWEASQKSMREMWQQSTQLQLAPYNGSLGGLVGNIFNFPPNRIL